MHAISSYRGNRPTNTQTHPQTHIQTHRQDQLQYTAPQLASAQCNDVHSAEHMTAAETWGGGKQHSDPSSVDSITSLTNYLLAIHSHQTQQQIQ